MIPLMLEEIISAIDGRIQRPDGDSPTLRARVTGVTIDSRQVRAGDLFFAIRGEKHDGHAFVRDALAAGAIAAIVARGYQPPADLDPAAVLVAVADTVHALGRLARFHRRQCPADVIAVTGSNGKTTTREMIAHVLRRLRRGRAAVKSFNNHIGVPLTLLSAEAGDEFLVVEVGTNAPGEIEALARLIDPDIAVVTGVAPAHLERLGTLDGVAAEKLSLLKHVRPGGCAIVNSDSDVVRFRLQAMKRPRSVRSPDDGGLPRDVKIITFGRHEEADLRLTSVRCEPGASPPVTEFVVNNKFRYRLAVPGEHNAMNALAAIAVGRRFGMSDDAIAERLGPGGGFVLPPMRLERKRAGRNGSIEIILDAYNANPASVAAAIDVLRQQAPRPRGRRVIVLGDMRELGSQAEQLHDEVARKVAASGIDVMLAIGEHARHMAQTARRSHKAAGAAAPFTARAVTSTDSAVRSIRRLCKAGDVVLIKGSRALGLERVADALADNGR